MTRPKMVFRTVRQGYIRLFGERFTPCIFNHPYRGELDGLRYGFHVHQREGRIRFATLAGWVRGDEHEFSDTEQVPSSALDWGDLFGPACRDGQLQWYSWRASHQACMARGPVVLPCQRDR